MSIRTAMDGVNSEIKKLHKEKEDLQNACKHKKSVDVIWSWRIGVNEPAKICADCDKLLKII